MKELLLTAALTNAEALINKTLTLDPVSLQRLQGLQGTAIELACTAPALHIYLLVSADGLRLFSRYEVAVDARIEGSATALLALLRTEDKRHAFYRKDLKITGQVEKIQALQDILRDLKPDWEYPLSKVLGDIPVHTLHEGLQTAGSQLRQGKNNLQESLDDYLHQESGLFPNRVELADFNTGVDDLRLRIDRARARLDNIEKQQATANTRIRL